LRDEEPRHFGNHRFYRDALHAIGEFVGIERAVDGAPQRAAAPMNSTQKFRLKPKQEAS
jgi:hypothetical protein